MCNCSSGLDVSTQVQPESGELFDFTIFVEPVLNVLVSKTIEQSLMEVRQELEMNSIRSRKVDLLLLLLVGDVCSYLQPISPCARRSRCSTMRGPGTRPACSNNAR